jgi:hypothetical protein
VNLRGPAESREAKKEWLRGYAAAMAIVQREHGESTVVADGMSEIGIRHRGQLGILKRAGVEEFDLKPIRACLPTRSEWAWKMGKRT